MIFFPLSIEERIKVSSSIKGLREMTVISHLPHKPG